MNNFQALVNKYFDSLDDAEENQFIGTRKAMAATEILQFLEWMDSPVPEVKNTVQAIRK